MVLSTSMKKRFHYLVDELKQHGREMKIEIVHIRSTEDSLSNLALKSEAFSRVCFSLSTGKSAAIKQISLSKLM